MKGSMLPSMRVLRISICAIVLVAATVTIIAVLARQKEDTTRIANARNLQQWGIALNLCLIENNNQLPEVGRTPVSADQTKAWFNLLPPYISEKPLADVPEGERPRPGVPSLWIRPDTKAVKVWDPSVFYFNYGMNRGLQPDDNARSFRIYEVSFPGNVIFLAPVSDYSPGANPEDVVFQNPSAPFAHILFCDGHVEAVPKEKLIGPDSLSADAAKTGPSWFRN